MSLEEKREEHKEYFGEKRGFGRRLGYGERPAVIVIDYMKAFTNPDMPLGASMTDELDATKELLTAAREAGLPIFFTVVYYDKSLREAGLWGIKQGGVASLIEGTDAVEIDPILDPHPEDQIVLKKYASAFFGTDLVARLNSQRIDTLLITGCTTSGCVRATAVDALQYGIRPIIIKETVADRWADAHKQALFDLDAKYGDVVTLKNCLEFVNQTGAK